MIKWKVLGYNAKESQALGQIFLHHTMSQKSHKACFMQTYNTKKGIKKFGTQGKNAAIKETTQLENREFYKPILLKDLTEKERSKAMDSLIFLTEKRDRSIKARA